MKIFKNRGELRASIEDFVGMAAKGRGGIVCADLPNLYGAVVASGGDTGAVGRPGEGIDSIGMATIDVDTLAIDRIPEAHRFIVTGGGNVGVIGRPCHRCDAAGMAGADEERILAWLRDGGVFRAGSDVRWIGGWN